MFPRPWKFQLKITKEEEEEETENQLSPFLKIVLTPY